MRTWVRAVFRRAGLVSFLLAGALRAGNPVPFTLRFGASGSMTLDMDPPDEILAFQLGYRTGALNGFDILDVPKPSITPPGGGVPILYFPADPPIYGLSQDYRPPAASQAWELDLVGMGPASTVTLQWRLQDGSLAGNPLSLVDQATGQILVEDMTATTSYVFQGADRTLLVLYGAANHPPVARGDEVAMLQSAGPLQIPFASLLANDYDPDAGDVLSVVAVGDPTRDPAAKGASAYGNTALDAANQRIVYTLPAPLPGDWTGVVYFTYTVSDDDPQTPYQTTATVQVTVAPDVLAVPVPSQVAARAGSPVQVSYTLTYSGGLHSLALSFVLPTAGSGGNIRFWPCAGSYSDDAPGTPDPAIDTGAGPDGQWGTADDTGIVVLDFGTSPPPSGTRFSFLLNVPADALDAPLAAMAAYRVTGLEVSPLEQVMPNLALRMAYVLSFASAGNGTLEGNAAQLLIPGQFCTAVRAVPAAGYHFLRWLRNGVEVSRANPLVIAGGTADSTIVAEFEIDRYTVTFAVAGNGRLEGPVNQTVEYGGNAAPVTAIPADGWYFNRWLRNGVLFSVDNPLTVVNVTGDMALVAEFLALEPADPAGDFQLVYRDATNPNLRKIWDITGLYAGNLGAYQLALNLAHDEKGAVTGTGRLSGALKGNPFDVANMPIKGRAKGKAGILTFKGSMSGTSGTTTVSLKLTLTLDPATLALTGTVTGSISDTTAGKIAVNSPCALALPAGMDGTYLLPVHLVLDAKGGITGTSVLTLSNGRVVALLVKGKRSGGTAVLKLSGDKLANPAFGAIKLKLTIRTYSNGTADIQAMAGKAFGQSLKWPF